MVGSAGGKARPAKGPVGAITRGTTAPNRLRRVDRWLVGPQAWRLRRAADAPVVVDLGYGASPVTTVELFHRLRRLRADVEVVGIEIDPDRVAAAAALARPGLRFVRGGFELPVPDDTAPTLVRAVNVLRQYDESEVDGAWARLRGRLSEDGMLVDGTCDEAGRLASWVGIERDRPVTLTVSMRLARLVAPSQVAPRLPKALAHRNIPGERVHDYLAALDRAWAHAAPQAAYGARQRFVETCARVRDEGWPVHDGPRRWRLGELTVDWSAVAPSGAPGQSVSGRA